MNEGDQAVYNRQKASYKDRKQAAAAAAIARKQYGVSLRPYLCRECGAWHLASSVA